MPLVRESLTYVPPGCQGVVAGSVLASVSHHVRTVGFFREHGGGDCHTQPSAARPMMSAGGSGAPHGDLLERGTRTLASGCPDGRRAYCTYNNEDSRGTPHQPTLPVRYNFHGVLGEARALPAAVRAAELRVRGAAVAWAIPPIPPGTQPGGAGTRSRAGVDKAECCFVLNHGSRSSGLSTLPGMSPPADLLGHAHSRRVLMTDGLP